MFFFVPLSETFCCEKYPSHRDVQFREVPFSKRCQPHRLVYKSSLETANRDSQSSSERARAPLNEKRASDYEKVYQPQRSAHRSKVTFLIFDECSVHLIEMLVKVKL